MTDKTTAATLAHLELAHSHFEKAKALREKAIVSARQAGATFDQIADALGVSKQAARTQVERLLAR